MKLKLPVSISLAALIVAPVLVLGAPQQPASTTSPASPPAYQAMVNQYCVACHNDKLKTAGISLEKRDFSAIPQDAETWEKVIRKLKVGAMPPVGLPRPEKAQLDGLTAWLETSIDKVALAHPSPGHATVHRLNRVEYANAVRDILGFEVDPTQILPPDDESYGFDNIADVLKVSPALMERYMSASWNISRLAVGDPNIKRDTWTYRARPDLSQDEHMEGLPYGTRGGLLIKNNFPLDGLYNLKVKLWRTTLDGIRGLEEPHEVEISVDGVRVKLVKIGGKQDESLQIKNSGASASDIDERLTIQIPVKAGPRTVSATFLSHSEAEDDGMMQPFIRTTLDPVDYRGLPTIDRLVVEGPYKPTGSGDTPSRRQIFTCRPTGNTDDVACARKILSTLARRAYRRPVNENDVEDLLSFYQRGRNDGKTFDAGIEAGIQLILSSPQFLFRFEPEPAKSNEPIYRISDVELASRLSFFLWSSVPDDQLISIAGQGKLHDPAVLDAQVRRMLADPKADALVHNFGGQFFFLRNLNNISPNIETFPDFDDNLRQSMRKETELFLSSIIREDRSTMDLLNADYTFVNERMAKHYGIPNVYGNDFRRVTITDPNRRGILGQASLLTVTSLATRTSPVERGKWILTNILNVPPPPPPPNVPALKDNGDGKVLSVRERMEAHRANSVCATCHKVMDPIGFSLENFDAIGQWRNTDDGAKIDPSGTLFNGTKVSGPQDLRAMLTSNPEVFMGVFTQRLMTYALGRGVEYQDMPIVRSIMHDAAKNDYHFSSLVLGIVNSAPFEMKMRKTETESRVIPPAAGQ